MLAIASSAQRRVPFILLLLLGIGCLTFVSVCQAASSEKQPGQLRIAHVAGLNVEVPPRGVGGLEKVVEVLIFEQLRQGHKVTLFCTDDSGQLENFNHKYGLSEEQLGNFELIGSGRNSLHIHTRNYEDYMKEVFEKQINVYIKEFMIKVYGMANQFDVLHFHSMDHFEFYGDLLRDYNDKILTTMHMALEPIRIAEMLARYPKAKLVSITENQRTHLKHVKGYTPNFIGTVYNGYPTALYKFTGVPKPAPFAWRSEYPWGTPSEPNVPYLAFLGRFSSDKGAHNAIRIALKAKMELRIAAKLSAHEHDYIEGLKKIVEEAVAEDEANEGLIKFIGEINDKQKNEFLGNAKAFLFPIQWQEPFGLVMIEAMACGTPVIAPRIASVPEVLGSKGGLTFNVVTKLNDEGETQVLYTDEVIAEAAQLVKEKADKMDRRAVRHEFESKFSVDVMVGGYEKLYRQMVAEAEKKKQMAAEASLNKEEEEGELAETEKKKNKKIGPIRRLFSSCFGREC